MPPPVSPFEREWSEGRKLLEKARVMFVVVFLEQRWGVARFDLNLKVISFGDPLGHPAPALPIQEVINWLDPPPKELATWTRALASISVFPIPQHNSPGSREVVALMAIEMSCNRYVAWESYESPLYHRIRFLKVLTTYTEVIIDLHLFR
jgi:hypothetical protein